MVAYVKGLHEVSKDVWAWLAPDGGWGWSNAGLVAGPKRSLLVDTLFDLDLTREMLTAMEKVTRTRPLSDAVNTHANGDHCYGNQLLGKEVTILAAPGVAEEMAEVPPALLAQATLAPLGQPFERYIKKCFGCFNFQGITLRAPDRVVPDDTTRELGGRDIRMIPLGPAHTHGDLVAFVPDASVLFAGDLLFIGGTPVVWAGPITNWMKACDTMIALDPGVVVPGHGPVTDIAGIRGVKAYLAHVDAWATAAHAKGQSWEQAAFEVDLDRFASLGDSERVVVNMYTAYRTLDPQVPTLSPVELFVKMAHWADRRGLLAE